MFIPIYVMFCDYRSKESIYFAKDEFDLAVVGRRPKIFLNANSVV